MTTTITDNKAQENYMKVLKSSSLALKKRDLY